MYSHWFKLDLILYNNTVRLSICRSVNNMNELSKDFFTHIRMLYGILTGIVLSMLLGNMGDLLTRDNWHPYWLHTYWCCYIIVFIIVDWWHVFHHRNSVSVNFINYLLFLSTPLLFYVLGSCLFPDDNINQKVLFVEVLANNQKQIFILISLIVLTITINAFIVEKVLYSKLNFIRLIIIVSTFVGAFIPVGGSRCTETYHALLIVFLTVFLIYFIFTYPEPCPAP